MRKRFLIILIIITSGITYFLFQMGLFTTGVVNDIPKNQTILNDGRWIHEEDSLAGIEIKDSKWILFYKGEQIEKEDIYDISITNELPKYANTEAKPGEFIILTNMVDTLHYELLGYSEDILSLMYFPKGNIDVYVPEKETKTTLPNQSPKNQ